ncbi:MAG: glycosyl hydrolase family 17 protein, partial [Melioribacteraceae bacterium]|nr:glycosyl hydrolase family 17 protein [Melioribacteraceae bacterium]
HRKFTGISGIDFSGMSIEELESLLAELLEEGIHGISFSAYLEGQAPGSQLSREQIVERMKILQPHVKWVRSFSCVDGNELIPQIAHEFGIKTLVGAWLGDDLEKNEEEIQAVIEVGKAGYADIIAVGNEVMLRGDLSEDDIINLIRRVKGALPDIPVGYVDAYYEFATHQRISDECDIIMANCYPFWEGFAFEHSLSYMKNMYQIAKNAASGKKVIISETGWPNKGSAERGAVPSYENAIKYFINAYNWAEQEDIEIFYFSSFDETWKIDAEGDVGAYWGLWDKDGNFKFKQNV